MSRVSYGLSDQELLLEAASLLQRGRLLVLSCEKFIPQGAAPSAPPKPVSAVAFPRPPRSSSSSAPAPVQRIEEPTFTNVDAAAQAAVLLEAARSGAPFCLE